MSDNRVIKKMYEWEPSKSKQTLNDPCCWGSADLHKVQISRCGIIPEFTGSMNPQFWKDSDSHIQYSVSSMCAICRAKWHLNLSSHLCTNHSYDQLTHQPCGHIISSTQSVCSVHITIIIMQIFPQHHKGHKCRGVSGGRSISCY